jgi:hypothetical protein
MLVRNPSKKRAYDIFHFLIDSNIHGADTIYSSALGVIPTTDIPPAVGLALKNYIQNPLIQEFIEKRLSTGISKATKAFNTR